MFQRCKRNPMSRNDQYAQDSVSFIIAPIRKLYSCAHRTILKVFIFVKVTLYSVDVYGKKTHLWRTIMFLRRFLLSFTAYLQNERLTSGEKVPYSIDPYVHHARVHDCSSIIGLLISMYILLLKPF